MSNLFAKVLCVLCGIAFAATASAVDTPLRDCPTCPEMVVIPAGEFDMGDNEGDADEMPLHHVNLAKPFAMSKTEVTQTQWRAVMQDQSRSILGNDPSFFLSCGGDCPVEQVSWHDVQIFIQKLNAKTRKTYRLPSEAEWEYACRAGVRQRYCGSDELESVANHGASADERTGPVPVAGKAANAFGLYDMSGNVWEWVGDSYHDDYRGAPTDGRTWQSDGKRRVLRGGSWFNEAASLRAASRHKESPVFRSKFAGFRLVRQLP